MGELKYSTELHILRTLDVINARHPFHQKDTNRCGLSMDMNHINQVIKLIKYTPSKGEETLPQPKTSPSPSMCLRGRRFGLVFVRFDISFLKRS